MKVEVKETGAGAYTLTVEVPAERVTEKVQALFKRVAREVVLPGFRRGHIPRALLEAQLGKDFLDEDVQSELIEETLPQALAQEALRPLSRPVTRVVAYEEGQPFRYEVEVEVLPEVAFPELAQVEVAPEPPPELDDDAVTQALEELKVQHAALLPKPEDQPAEWEDVAVVRLPDGEEREILLTSGSRLAEQLVGHRAGEAVEVALEGQTFPLTLSEIKVLDKPDLEELAATLGHDGADALLDSVRAELEDRLAHEHRQQVRYKALDALIERAEVPVPPRLKEEVIEHELAALERSGRVGALSADDRAAYAEGAEQRLRREVALEAFKRQHAALRLSDEEFETALEAEAEKQGMNPVKYKALLEREGQLQRVRDRLEDERVLDHLVAHVTWTEPAPQAKSTAKGQSKEAKAKPSNPQKESA